MDNAGDLSIGKNMKSSLCNHLAGIFDRHTAEIYDRRQA
jgi:hypothetical protein